MRIFYYIHISLFQLTNVRIVQDIKSEELILPFFFTFNTYSWRTNNRVNRFTMSVFFYPHAVPSGQILFVARFDIDRETHAQFRRAVAQFRLFHFGLGAFSGPLAQTRHGVQVVQRLERPQQNGGAVTWIRRTHRQH